ncbi:MAG TPA: glycoside hydrolase family 99-like domain-containing protein [Acidobacteriota bacterium]
MNRRRLLLAALAAAASDPAFVAGSASATGSDPASAAADGPVSTGEGIRAAAPDALPQAPVGVTGIDYFPVYYTWYSEPRRWNANPDYLPALGAYRSDQRSTIAQHLGWLDANGGAGFTVNWHGPEGFVHQTLQDHFIPEIGGFPGQEFCIHCDPFIRWGLPMPDFTRDQTAAVLWRGDARHIARSFMSHPQYARVNGRPLLFIYLARAIEGLDSLEAFVEIVRDEVAEAGHPGVYLVLGEAWWIPANETPVNLEIIRSTRAPRTRVGDAVYSYNLATEPEHERIWRGNIRTFLGEAGRVYKDYRNLMDARGAADRQVITTLMPRFDNTLLRRLEGGPPGMNIGPWRGHAGLDFERDVAVVLDKLSTSFEPVRGDRTLMVVTSWNEWPERSALEPSFAGTDKDGLPAPRDAYLTALGGAVAAFPPPNDPGLRPGGLSTSRRRGLADRADALLQEVDVALDMSGLTSEQTENVTLRHVTGGRVAYRAQLAAGVG